MNGTSRAGRMVGGVDVAQLAAELRQADAAGREALVLLDEGAASQERSERATARSRRLVGELDSLVRTLSSGIESGSPSGIDETIGFLEVDPWCRYSGYAKSHLMRRLVSVDLSPAQVERLSVVVLAAVDAGMRWEMRDTMRLARRLGGRTLRRELRSRVHAEDRPVAWRAMVVLTELRHPGLTERDRVRIRELVLWDLRNLQDDGRGLWKGWSVRAARTVLDDDWVRELERLRETKGMAEPARSLLEIRRH